MGPYAYPFKMKRSGGSVVDHALDYQSRDRKIDPLLWLISGLSGLTLNRGPVSV